MHFLYELDKKKQQKCYSTKKDTSAHRVIRDADAGGIIHMVRNHC